MSLETCQRIVIHVLTCDELPFVETHTVVKQLFDVGNDQRLGELVNGMLQLTDNLLHVILQNDALFR